MHDLWRHPNGIWYVLYGPRLKRRVSTRSKDRGEAERFLAQFIAGTAAPLPDITTVAAILDGYETDSRQRVRSPESLRYAVAALKLRLGELLPHQLLPVVTRHYATARGAAAGTILREIGVLRAALAWAVEHQWISTIPVIRNPVKTPRPRERWATREEARRLLAACQEPHLRAFVALGFMTAARTEAILELKWDQIGPDTIDFGEGHGNKRRAVVPINDELRRILAAARELACTEYVIERHGKRLLHVTKGFRAACRRAGLMGITPHIMRHSAATWMAMDGVPLREMARLLGDSEETVERVYAKHTPGYLARAAGALQLGLSAPESALHLKGTEPETSGSLPENVVKLRP